MSGEIEAAGALATAGLVAGAIEGREAQGAGEGVCLNCGAKLVGPYCAQCGQAGHANRTLVHVLGEFLHGVFHFDTKVWRTLPMVVARPGTLTRNYVYGKRARYVSPLAFFLLTIFFMFAMFAFTETSAPVNVTETASVEEAQASVDQARTRLAEARTRLAELERTPADDPPGAEGLALNLAQQAIERGEAAVARREAALQRARAREQAAADGAAVTDSVAADEAVVAPVQVGPAEGAAPDAGPVQIEVEDGENRTWQDAAREIAESDDFVIVQGWDSFNESVRQKLRNPDLAAYKIQEAASTFSFLLVPISLPFIALLFLWKRGVTFYDHVVFALYALSFASLLFVGIVLAAQVDWLRWFVPTSILVGIPAHTFFHLKGAYALGWFSALWRTFFMLIFATIALSIFIVAIIILGLAG